MIYILISVLLFGLVHPMSKLILDTGVPLSYFCILYVGIRLLFQLFFIFYKKTPLLIIKKNIRDLLLLGLVGAGLQYFEFKGIEEGLSPGVVTFLMFSFPIWILIFSALKQKERLYGVSVFKLFAGIGGIYFISQANVFSENLDVKLLIYPILAGFFIAMWVFLTSSLRKKDIDSFSLSIFYDLFSLVSLVLILSNDLVSNRQAFVDWLIQKDQIFSIIVYSIVAGLLPNILFYYGSRFVKAITASFAMSMEPVLSVLYSSFIWGFAFHNTFVLGALLICLINIPDRFWSRKLRVLDEQRAI